MQSKRFRKIASSAGVALLASGAANAAAPSLSFDHVFTAAGEPAALHFHVLYASQGVHRMEVWRDRERQVKRATDAAIVSLATHQPRETGYRLTLLDLKKRIATKIDRTNLYRVGNFTDWFDLTHGLRHPKGPYVLTKGTAPAGMPGTVGHCQWYRLAQGPRTVSICWDARNRVPLLMASGDNHPIWRVTQLDTKPATAAVFMVDTRGFTMNDANRDIERD